MAKFAITKGTDGDPISARRVRNGMSKESEFVVDEPGNINFKTYRIGPNDTIREETTQERQARTKVPTPGERAQEILRSPGFERQLVKALATRFGISVSELIKEIRDA